MYDQTPPEIELNFNKSPESQGSGQFTLARGTLLSIQVTDRHSEVKSVNYSLDGAPGSTYFKPIPFSDSGTYTLTITAVDLVGNQTENIYTVTVTK